jgi:hypothetical protein
MHPSRFEQQVCFAWRPNFEEAINIILQIFNYRRDRRGDDF